MSKEQPAANLDTHGIELVGKLALAAAEPVIAAVSTEDAPGLPANVPLAFGRDIQQFRSLKPLMEEWRLAPSRRKGEAKADTLASFIAMANRAKDADSVLFGRAAMPNPSLLAVIDYNRADGGPRFGQHRIRYDFPLTYEFSAWMTRDGAPMEQLAFANFLEDHVAELAAPTDAERSLYEPLFKARFATPIELIQLSRELEVHVGQKVKRQERLQTGERVIEFTAEHLDAKGGKVDIPGIFMLSVPAFVDGAAVRIPARLRYRVSGDVVWTYLLYRPEFFLREQVQHDLADAAKQTGLPAFEGSPEAN